MPYRCVFIRDLQMKVEETKECVAEAVRLLDSDSLEKQIEGIEALGELGPYGRLMRIGLSPEQALTLLLAAFRKYPPSDNFLDLGETYRQKLLRILCQSSHPILCSRLLELYPQIEPEDDGARWQALHLLSEMPQREGVEAWIRWYTERFDQGNGVPPPFSSMHCHVEHADLLLPAMVKFSKSDNAWLADQWNAHLQKLLSAESGDPSIYKNLIEDLHHLLDRLNAFPIQAPGDWMWERDYFDLRWKLFSRAELLGYTSEEAVDVLRRAVAADDPKIRLGAAVALLRLGESMNQEILSPVAAWPETRYALFTQLKELKKSSLFPREFAKQHLLAESDLVAYCTEDGEPPPESLEYGGSITHDGNVFHVFEFVAANERKLGLSGPWPQKGLQKARMCGIGTTAHMRDSEALLIQAAKQLA